MACLSFGIYGFSGVLFLLFPWRGDIQKGQQRPVAVSKHTKSSFLKKVSHQRHVQRHCVYCIIVVLLANAALNDARMNVYLVLHNAQFYNVVQALSTPRDSSFELHWMQF